MVLGFRYRKSVKILPGVKLNISKSGVSTSVGKPGATVNFSKRGTRVTTGIPGTGLSYSQNVSKNKAHQSKKSAIQDAQGKLGLKNHEMKWLVKKLKRNPKCFAGYSDEQVIKIVKRHMRVRAALIMIVFFAVLIYSAANK